MWDILTLPKRLIMDRLREEEAKNRLRAVVGDKEYDRYFKLAVERMNVNRVLHISSVTRSMTLTEAIDSVYQDVCLGIL